MTKWFSETWERLIQSSGIEDARESYLSRILNIILLLLILWGIGVEIQDRIQIGYFDIRSTLIFIMLLLLVVTYFLNHSGYFLFATISTLVLFVSMTFFAAILQHLAGTLDLSALYYLTIAILIAEFFLSFRGYLIAVLAILAGVLAISFFHTTADLILAFLFVFSLLITFSSYNRRTMEDQQTLLSGKFVREQTQLSIEQRRSARLGLLEEVGRQISESLNEQEILQRTVEAIVNRFGYAEAAISQLVEDNMLEITAISGTQDYGYRPGYRQQMGMGIIGYVAKTRKSYIANDVQKDPYYFSNTKNGGAAISVPIMDEKELFGVLYIESTERGSFNMDDTQMVYTLANQVASSIQRARLYTRAQEHLRVMDTVQSISQIVSSSLDLEEIFHTTVRLLRDTFRYSHVSIYLMDGEYLHIGAQSGYDERMVFRKLHIDQGVIGHTAQTKKAQFIQDVTVDPHFLRASTDVNSEICVPLLKEDIVLGVINVEADVRSPLMQNDLDLLNLLAGPIALAVDNARLHSQVKEMAMTDAVSGLSNRHAFEETLNAEVSRAQRYGHPLSLIIFDLDSFKDYNDSWGHPAGDIRLKATAELIRSNLRKHDIPARYGGDEFAIILPNTPREGAIHFANRLLAAAQASIEEKPSDGKAVPGYTLSIGVATFPQDGNTIASILLAADQAELMAKRLGKNRIFSANDLTH